MINYVEEVARRVSSQLAQRLGVQEPPDAWRAFAAQVANETAHGDPSTRGVRNNNPLNLRPAPDGTWSGQVAVDSEGGGPFAIFATTEEGVAASVQNLLAPSYAGIRSAFTRGDPYELAEAIEASPWDAGHYGGALERLLPAGSVASTGLPLPSSTTIEFDRRTPNWTDQAAAIDRANERNRNPAPTSTECPMGYQYDASTNSCKSWVPFGIVPNVPVGNRIPISGDEAFKKVADPIVMPVADAVGGAIGKSIEAGIAGASTKLVEGGFTLAVGAAVVIVVLLFASKGVDRITS